MELTPKTRKETFLAAAGGQNVETPTPITREEVFLNEIAKGGGGSSLPPTKTASAGDVLSLDDNKEPQWAAPSGSGGGVLVVHEVNGALDKTYKQIIDALHANGVILEWAQESGTILVYCVVDYGEVDGAYLISFHTDSAQTNKNDHYYAAESENGYPVNDD